VHFYNLSKIKSRKLRRNKGRDVVCKSPGSRLRFCQGGWSGRHSNSSHRLCSPAFRATSLVCDCFESESWSIALSVYNHTHTQPSLSTRHRLCAFTLNTRLPPPRATAPHNTQQTCPTTATTAAVTLAPASTSLNLSTPLDAFTNTLATENTMPTCWKKTTIKSTT
jgi:hypothetical protein